MDVVAFMVGLLFMDRLNAALDQRLAGRLAAMREGWALEDHARELAEADAESEARISSLAKALADIRLEVNQFRVDCSCPNCRASRAAGKGD